MKKKKIYLRISENNAGTTGIFYGKLGLAILTCDATLKNKASQSYVTVKSQGYVPMALER
jgi:hypothetical protein